MAAGWQAPLERDTAAKEVSILEGSHLMMKHELMYVVLREEVERKQSVSRTSLQRERKKKVFLDSSRSDLIMIEKKFH